MPEVIYENRVYIGNVEYRTTPEELTAFFEGLNVQAVEIPSKPIVKNSKSYEKCLGFAFLQFSTPEEAQVAVEDYNGKEFKQRIIGVKKALPPKTEEEKQAKREAYLMEKKQSRKKRQAENRARRKIEAAEQQAAGETTEKGTPNNVKKQAKKEKATPEGIESKDTIFITNLDYKANSKTIGSMFQDYQPVWVKVPMRSYSYEAQRAASESKRPAYNKGIAFVKFKNEEDQRKAIQQYDGAEFGGRNLKVESAVSKPSTGDISMEAAEPIQPQN